MTKCSEYSDNSVGCQKIQTIQNILTKESVTDYFQT